MIFAILTLFSALTLAAVAGWFSIAGVMAIYAGAPMHAALVMGVTLELAKLITTSWLYRNWEHASWQLKLPLMYFLIALMVATSIGVFGFLSKSHLEQGSATIDNTAKVERLDQQIAREQSIIADNEKVISQLDATVNSFIGKDQANRAVVIRRSQAVQRKQLRADIDAAYVRINSFSDQKFELTAEVRALSLEVGPIRYIADLFYTDDVSDNVKVETAVKLFTLLIVSTLDPLAVILLIAANHTLLRLKNEEKALHTATVENTEVIATPPPAPSKNDSVEDSEMGGNDQSQIVDSEDALNGSNTPPREVENGATLDVQIPGEETRTDVSTVTIIDKSIDETVNIVDTNDIIAETVDTPLPVMSELAETIDEIVLSTDVTSSDDVKIEDSDTHMPVLIKTPEPTRVDFRDDNESSDDTAAVGIDSLPAVSPAPWAHQSTILRELLGDQPHFVPEPVIKKQLIDDIAIEIPSKDLEDVAKHSNRDKYPKALSWLKEFKGD